jgi:N-acetylglutamate synthase-like GNAT family acetyltransferase
VVASVLVQPLLQGHLEMVDTVIARRSVGGHSLEVDTDRHRLDVGLIHNFLAHSSHWARGIPLATLNRAIAHSICFGLYKDGAQIGFARVVSDRATFAYLADVFVVDAERGDGLGQWLIESILSDPHLGGLRRWLLVTRDAQHLYRRCGFTDLASGFQYMERLDPEIYTDHSEQAASA